ncbi:hypothetical protein D3C77_645920 [compost metagenome]
MAHVTAWTCHSAKRIDGFDANALHSGSCNFAIKSPHPEARLCCHLIYQSLCGYRVDPQSSKGLIKTILTAQDVSVSLTRRIARELDEPVLSYRVVRNDCIWVKVPRIVFDEQKLRGLATRTESAPH